MTRLDRYILGQIATPTILGLFLVGFLAIAARISLYAREIPMDLLTAGDVSQLSILFVPSLISMIIPVTFLLGTLMAFARMAQQGELMAMKAAGIPLKRVAAPVVFVAFGLAGLCFAVQDGLQPWAIGRAFDLLYRELPQRATVIMLRPGVMHDYEGWRIFFERKDLQTNTIHNVDLIQPSEGQPSVFHAASARFTIENDEHVLRLLDCSIFQPDGSMGFVEEYTLSLPIPSPERARGARQALALSGLLENEKQLSVDYDAARERGDAQDERDALRKERKEIAERVSLPFAVVAVTLVGAPLGVRARRAGRSYTFALGFGIILLYYTVQILVDPPTVRSLSTHILNAAVPNALLAIIGMVLIWRVDRV